ncbi:MAG: hypothetical protein ACQESR_03565 [Planctomycetota bacterium]
MAEPGHMERYARRVARDAAAARGRSLNRRLGGELVWKYLHVVPSVFTARGGFSAFQSLVPAGEALVRLKGSAVLTLDSASELLGGLRFGSGRHVYAYFEKESDVDAIVTGGIGKRLRDARAAMLLASQEDEKIFAVVCQELPPHREYAGHRVVTREHLVRDFLGFHGLRRDLIVELENKINRTDGMTLPLRGG